jgi:signal transduction histidine kinase/ligand-binding sensor domain-containing protein/DNA-binding response OmpR family regulator
MKRGWLTYVLLAAWLYPGQLLFGQSVSHTPIVFLDTEQGLSNNTVRCIYKDHNGFMWFGTRDGLNRYDGNSFRVFRHQFQDSNSLVCDFVLSLNEDSANRLWIGTRQGLNTYNNLTGKFSVLSWLSAEDHVIRPVTSLIKDLQKDAQGNMLVGTEGQGLLMQRQKDGNTLAQLPFNDGISNCYHYGVQAIRTGDDGRVWVLVQNKGLCLLDNAGGRLILVNRQLPLAGCLENTGSGLWIGSGNVLYHFDPASNRCTPAWELPGKDHTAEGIWVIKKDKNDHLLIGTMLGRFLTWNINTRRLTQTPETDSIYLLRSGTIYGLFVDEFANQWLATAKEGVGVIDPQHSRFHANRQTKFVTSFYESPDSSLWIGTEGEGLLQYHRQTGAFAHYRSFPADRSSLSGDMIMSICGDYQGKIWAAAQFSGIDRFDPVTRRFQRYHCSTGGAGSEKNWVWTVYEDKRKDLWVTTLRQGSLMGALYRFDRVANRFAVFDSSLSDLFSLYEDRSGALWGGNLAQLVAIDRSKRRAHRVYEMGAAVRAICEDRTGMLWVGTEGGGLLLFDKQQNKVVSRYSTDEGLCNNSVLGILEDDNGDLWLSTGNGLSRFNPMTRRFRNYYQADGLQSNQFVFGSAVKLHSGEFAFGGIKGFNVFDPLAIRETNLMPGIKLTDILVNGVPLEKDPSFVSRWGTNQVEEIKVPYNKAYFSFDFAALEYSTPKEISYSYFMEGWDRKWTMAGHQRKATYTHLNEGSYTFLVKSTNPEGKWNSEMLSLRIIVLPPWYRSWWAYTLYVLLAASLIYVYWLYKTRQAKLKYEFAIARLNAEKERSEHEKKLSFFTNISHEFRTPLTLIINPVKDLLRLSSGVEQAELNVIHRNARRMLSLVDQLLLFRKADSGADQLNPVKLDLYHLCREVYFSFTQQARARNIHYEFECDKEPLELYADREKVEIIIFNLVSNALKYTPEGGRVSLIVSEGPDNVEVRVTDSGPGIPAGTGERIFERFYQVSNTAAPPKPGFGIGLFLARQFAQEHKGELFYQNNPGDQNNSVGGVVFTLRLLKGFAHFEGLPLLQDGSSTSELFKELVDEAAPEETVSGPEPPLQGWVDEKRSVLIIDDDTSMRQYVTSIFRDEFTVYTASDGKEGQQQALEHLPDIIISDIKMEGLNGIDLCRTLKSSPTASHIPIILLTGTLSADLQLEGVEGGADDYITKPFDKDLLLAKVANLLQSRINLRQSLFNEITHNNDTPRKISADDKAFLDKCTAIVEAHLDEEEFTIRNLALEMGTSHSSLYKKIKALSGHSLNGFIRLIRLRNAAILCINSTYTVNEIAMRVGILDRTHFREQFQKVYGMTAAEYIRKYRKPFTADLSLKRDK